MMMSTTQTAGYSLKMFDDIQQDPDDQAPEASSNDGGNPAPAEEEMTFNLGVAMIPSSAIAVADTAPVAARQDRLGQRLSSFFSSRATRAVAAISASLVFMTAAATTVRNAIVSPSLLGQIAPVILDEMTTQSVLKANQTWVIPESEQAATDSFSVMAGPR